MAKSKVKRYANEGYVYEDDTPEEVANRSDSSQSIANEAKGDTMLKAMRDEAAKPKTVSKEDLAKSGLSLRDYMNQQQGLTRRGESSSKPAKVTDTGDDAARMAKRAPKPELKYQSLQDREIESEAKRRASGKSFYGDSVLSKGINAIKERIAGNASGERGQDRVLKDASIKKSEQKFMGSGMKSGGSIASRRADGIAQRGKTRGKYL